MALVRNSFLYVLGDIFVKIVPFILLPYLTASLGSSDYGELAYYQFYISLFTILLSFSQGGILTRYFFRYGHRSIGLLLSNSNYYTLIIGGGLLCILPFVWPPLFFILLVAISTELIASQLTLRICHGNVKNYIFINSMLAISSISLTFLLFRLFEPDRKSVV